MMMHCLCVSLHDPRIPLHGSRREVRDWQARELTDRSLGRESSQEKRMEERVAIGAQ